MNLFNTGPLGLAGKRVPLRALLANSTFRQVMRISFVHMILLIGSLKLLSASPAEGQDLENIKVTLDVSHAPLSRVFDDIQDQTNLSFVFPNQVNNYTDVTLARGTYSVKEVLDNVLKGTSLGYKRISAGVAVFVKGKDMSPEVDENQAAKGMTVERRVVSGKIVDGAAEPIPGVNIMVQGTTRGTTSDTDGKYSIDVESYETLVFSFIGFKALTVEVSERTIIDVTLEQDAAMLSEVTVNGGYYETTDKLKTGSIVTVTAKDIEKQPVTNPLMSLQGRVPGLEITPSAGTPGVAPTIRIRGTNSLRNSGDETGGNYPLYVIDGVPVNSAPVNSFTSLASSYTKSGYDPLSTINPSNIESIEVLKDGDATAIYGSRGANGVILITTKKSKSKGKANIDLTIYSGIGNVSRMIHTLDTKHYLAMRREALGNDGLSPDQYDYDLKYWDTTRHTNWQKLLLGNSANITDAQTNISAGTSNTSFRIGGGYHKETLVFPGQNGYQRATGNMSLNHNSSNNKFRVAMTINYGFDKSRLFNDLGGIVNAALTLPAFAPKLYNPDGSLNWEVHDLGGISRSTWANPMSFTLDKQETTTKNLVANSTIAYEIISRLTISGSIGYTDLNSSETAMVPKASLAPEINAISGTATFNINKRASWILEPKLNYSKSIGKHDLSVVAGATWQANNSEYSILGGSQYSSDALLGSLKGAGLIESYRDDVISYKYMSLYSRIGYNFDGKYLINLTGRRDGSSRFGSGNRFGNFGAVGGAWIFSKEDYIQNKFSFINFGKLRTSFGVTGSDQIGDYGYYNLYDSYAESYQGVRGIQSTSLFNPNFKWELTKKLEGAIELGFFDNRLGLEINWYRNLSSNQLVNYPLSLVTGFSSVLTNFNATIQNTGWEISVRGDLLNSEDWTWKASANISLPHNRLVRFDGIENSPYATVYEVGKPLSVKSLYHFTGLNSETGLYEFEDKNNDGVINAADKSLFYLQPKVNYYGGVNNTIQYKEFELSFLFQFAHQTRQEFLPDMPGRSGINQPIDVLQRWQHSGDRTDVQRFATISGPGDPYTRFLNFVQSNRNIANASFVRLKTVSLTYRLKAALIDKFHLTGLRIFVQGQNLFTITPYDGLDPETGNTLPPLRMITLGIQITL
jgi:TonB-linked SusC/RagA family outer membrane protein